MFYKDIFFCLFAFDFNLFFFFLFIRLLLYICFDHFFSGRKFSVFNSNKKNIINRSDDDDDDDWYFQMNHCETKKNEIGEFSTTNTTHNQLLYENKSSSSSTTIDHRFYIWFIVVVVVVGRKCSPNPIWNHLNNKPENNKYGLIFDFSFVDFVKYKKGLFILTIWEF